MGSEVVARRGEGYGEQHWPWPSCSLTSRQVLGPRC
jgi:hypothetical protein